MVQDIYEQLSSIPGITDHLIIMLLVGVAFALVMVLVNEALKNTFTKGEKRTAKEKSFWKKFCLFSGFFTGTLYGYFFKLYVIKLDWLALIRTFILWFAVGMAFVATQTAIYHFGSNFLKSIVEKIKSGKKPK